MPVSVNTYGLVRADGGPLLESDLIGPQGAKGDTGATGETGAKGDPGEPREVGEIILHASPVPPSAKWLRTQGQAVTRTTYPQLFAALNPSIGTATISVANPGVVTTANHGLVVGDRVWLTTTGALPTGLIANTRYWVATTPTSSTLTLAVTEGGPAIALSGTQSGTHTLLRSPYGLGDGTTTFGLPDLAGRAPLGPGAGSGLTVRPVGQTVGTETHLLTEAQMPPHVHQPSGGGGFISGGGGAAVNLRVDGSSFVTSGSTASTGGGLAHPNMQPSIVMPYYIRALP